MMHFRQVFFHASFLFIARLIFRGLNAAVVIFIARFLGGDRYGYYETALAIVNVLLVFNDLGMSTLLVKEASRDVKKLPVFFGNTLVVETLLSLVVYGLMVAAAWLLYPGTPIGTLVALLGAAQLIFEHRKVFRGGLRVLFKLSSLGWIEIVNGIINFIVLALITKLTDPETGLFRLAEAQVVINLIIVGLFAFYALTIAGLKPRIQWSSIVSMIKQSYLFSLTQLFTMIYFSVDQIIISKLRPIEEVGWYSAPFKIIIFLIMVPQMIFQVIQPLMFRLAKEDLDRYKRIHFTLVRYLTAFGAPIGAFFIFYAKPFMLFLFGNEFVNSGRPLQWFGGFIIVFFIASAAEYSLVSLDRQADKARIQFITIVANAILDVILVLKYGFFGAAVATFFVELFLAGSLVWMDLRVLKEGFGTWIKNIWKPLLATAVTFLLLPLLIPDTAHVTLVLTLGLLIHVVFLIGLKFFNPYDLGLLKQLLPHGRSDSSRRRIPPSQAAD